MLKNKNINVYTLQWPGVTQLFQILGQLTLITNCLYKINNASNLFFFQ